jgi:hypothetical protein
LLSGIVVAAGLIWHYRSRSNEVLMAIAAVVAYVSTYHQRYDAVILIFLLVPLAGLALRHGSKAAWAALVLNGLFLWFPFTQRLYFIPAVITSHCAVAIWGLCVLLRGPAGNALESRQLQPEAPFPGAAT